MLTLLHSCQNTSKTICLNECCTRYIGKPLGKMCLTSDQSNLPGSPKAKVLDGAWLMPLYNSWWKMRQGLVGHSFDFLQFLPNGRSQNVWPSAKAWSILSSCSWGSNVLGHAIRDHKAHVATCSLSLIIPHYPISECHRKGCTGDKDLCGDLVSRNLSGATIRSGESSDIVRLRLSLVTFFGRGSWPESQRAQWGQLQDSNIKQLE